MITHPHLVLLSVQVVDHIVGVLVVIINTNTTTSSTNTSRSTTLIAPIMIIPIADIIVTTRLTNIQTIVSLVVTVTIGSVILVGIQVLRITSRMLLRSLAGITSIVVEHC